jgi:2-aminoethylphosphonate-pyruvate transaminase
VTASRRIVLTPGPVTTSSATRQAMLRDYSLNEPDFLALTAEVRATLLGLVEGQETHVCVLLQGTGNAANEATLGTLVRRDRRVLIVNNGFYGGRLAQMAPAIGLDVVTLDLPITEPVSPGALAAALDADPAIAHVALCHVDTGTGLLNPLEPLAAVCRARGIGLIVDAVASFGGLPLDAPALGAEAIVLTPNKWLEGVPGFAAVVVERTAMAAAAGRCHSFCLDLHRQWRSFEESGRWRFTPPTHALAALAAALREHGVEGREARLARVRQNWRRLVDGLRAQGFATVLADEVAAPVIATFHQPADPAYDRERFFEAMWRRGFVMFRGSLTPFPTFRIGCMGNIDAAVMSAVVRAVGEAMAEMGVRDCRPAPLAAE